MSLRRSLLQLPWLAKFNLVLLGLLVASLTVLLWPHWRSNPDLSHGLFMLPLFLLLLHESRHGHRRYLRTSAVRSVSVLLLVTAGVLLLAASGLYAAAVGWSHALVAFGMTTAATLLLGAGWLVFSGDRLRLLPFNWTALVAIALWLLCSPLPPGTYSRLTLGLQLSVSQHVLSALHLLGVAASRHGNVIELANTSVGVEEACSGVRSLISCIYAGFFFSATIVQRPWARGVIIALSAPLALVMNFLRSLFLTLLANRGVDIAGTWHDVTGFSVLVITALILGGLAFLFAQGQSEPTREGEPVMIAPLRSFSQLSLGAGLACALMLGLFFWIKTSSVPGQAAPKPELDHILPATATGWRVETDRHLYRFSGILQTQDLIQRTYLKPSPGGEIQLTVYLAYWNAGQSSVSEVSMHTPDACWPGSGWVATPIAPQERLPLLNRLLPEAEARKFHNGPYPQYVWFWHLYNGRPIMHGSPRDPMELLRVVWRYGFTRNGTQLFVRVSSNRRWDEIKNEPLVAEIFGRLQPLGL